MDRERLADFLRRRRGALQPEDVGLPAAPRRRTPGLRREEVALLASMSSDYYTRLEQARGPQPSPQMLAALTRALRLSLVERDHLHRLAGHPPPASEARSDHVSPGVLRVLDRIDTPSLVLNDLGEVLAQNRHAVALLGDETRFAPDDLARSRVYRWFADPQARRIHPVEEHPDYSRSYAAMLHLAAGRHPGDARTRAMVDRLLEDSAEFARLWADHDVTWRPGPERKTFLHPLVGPMLLDCERLSAQHDTQVVLVYTATPGTDSAERLRLLEVVGQGFADGDAGAPAASAG